MQLPPIQKIDRIDPSYPERLKSYENMPESLYVIGRLPDDTEPTAAIVGARLCTGYGHDAAYEFARVLAGNGVGIVSGLASGIDGYAQRGAIDVNGRTYAVLASGVDVCYPRSNYDLYQRIPASGGIISENVPGTQPLRGYFPLRNRIISALSDVVIIVEARIRSGSLITADCALEQGKSIFAVPGRIDDVCSEGCHKLIAQGAFIAYSPQAVLDELDRIRSTRISSPSAVRRVIHIDKESAAKNGDQTDLPLSAAANMILIQLSGRLDVTPADLAAIHQLPVPLILAALTELQLAGYVEETVRGHYRKCRR